MSLTTITTTKNSTIWKERRKKDIFTFNDEFSRSEHPSSFFFPIHSLRCALASFFFFFFLGVVCYILLSLYPVFFLSFFTCISIVCVCVFKQTTSSFRSVEFFVLEFIEEFTELASWWEEYNVMQRLSFLSSSHWMRLEEDKTDEMIIDRSIKAKQPNRILISQKGRGKNGSNYWEWQEEREKKTTTREKNLYKPREKKRDEDDCKENSEIIYHLV